MTDTQRRDAACGSWPDALGSADLTRGALRLSAPQWLGETLFWIEGRPSEGGRQVLMAGDRSGEAGAPSLSGLREMSPAEANVRTRVHEYGGGEFALAANFLCFVDDRDGAIWSQPLQRTGRGVQKAGAPRPLARGDSRYADLVCSPDGRWLAAIEELPREGEEPQNRLVCFPMPTSPGNGLELARPRIVAEGHDFYASPTFSPDTGRLAFLAWDHPAMPWNGTVLETVEWNAQGPAGPPRHRAGGPSESVFQPRFSARGELFAMSDQSGFWNLVAVGEGGSRGVHEVKAELGRAQWVFGLSSWDFLSPTRVLASATHAGRDEWLCIDLESGQNERLPSADCQLGGVAIEGGWLACLAGSPTSATALCLSALDAAEGAHHAPRLTCVRASTDWAIAPEAISVGEPRVFEGPSGESMHAFVYAPASASAKPRKGEKPPLLVKSHGGPTASASSALDPRIQYWTQRGFAIADINYRGSTGYGRAYRDALEGGWGVLDVEDCVGVAEALAEEGTVDGDRLAISGGSAGGYTTLCALTFHSVFKAGASHYGIGDLEALVRDTHKFESRYTDWLVGPWPEARATYLERSPIQHQERLACPMIFFQGLEDKVVPPNQAEAMVAVLAKRGIAHAYVPFEGEQHGFRQAANIQTALDGELYFYSRIFGFEAPRPPSVDVVAGRNGAGE